MESHVRTLLLLTNSLSPPQRPLSCCFVRKGGPGPGESEKPQCAGNAGKGKERREASAIFCAVGWSRNVT